MKRQIQSHTEPRSENLNRNRMTQILICSELFAFTKHLSDHTNLSENNTICIVSVASFPYIQVISQAVHLHMKGCQ